VSRESKIFLPAGLGALLLFLFSREDSKADTYQDTGTISPSDYIKRYYALAKQTETYYAVPAAFTLAQAGLESNWGNSNIAREANNHFGIKADGSWSGPVYNTSGNRYRKYNSVQESYDDHGKFLVVNPRYDGAFNSKDPFIFGASVANAGYAEDPNYYSLISNAIKSVNNII